MHKYEIVDATIEHVKTLAPNLSEDDKKEIHALGARSPEDALMRGWRRSTECKAWLVDGEPLALCGISYPTVISEVVQPWMLGSEKLRQHARAFLRDSAKIVRGKWMREYKYMEGYSHWEYQRNVKWLRWLGFTIHPPEPMGPYNELFCRFTMRGE